MLTEIYGLVVVHPSMVHIGGMVPRGNTSDIRRVLMPERSIGLKKTVKVGCGFSGYCELISKHEILDGNLVHICLTMENYPDIFPSK